MSSAPELLVEAMLASAFDTPDSLTRVKENEVTRAGSNDDGFD